MDVRVVERERNYNAQTSTTRVMHIERASTLVYRLMFRFYDRSTSREDGV